jgi:hypothetical protein
MAVGARVPGSTDPIELDRVVTPSGNMTLRGNVAG